MLLGAGAGSEGEAETRLRIVKARERAAAVEAGRLPAPYVEGLRNTVWPGRNQVLRCVILCYDLLRFTALRCTLKHALRTSLVLLCAPTYTHVSLLDITLRAPLPHASGLHGVAERMYTLSEIDGTGRTPSGPFMQPR